MTTQNFDINSIREHSGHDLTVEHLGEPYRQTCLMCITCSKFLIELDDEDASPLPGIFKVDDYVDVIRPDDTDSPTPEVTKYGGRTGKVEEVTPIYGPAGTTGYMYDVRFDPGKYGVGLFYSVELVPHPIADVPTEVQKAFDAGAMFVVDPELTNDVDGEPEPATLSESTERLVDNWIEHHKMITVVATVEPVIRVDDLSPQYYAIYINEEVAGKFTGKSRCVSWSMTLGYAKSYCRTVNEYLNQCGHGKGGK